VAHSIKRIRTIALVGQSGAGKTSLAEALLAKAGAIPAAGSVERGGTVCDYTPLEKQLQHSLKLAVAAFDFQRHQDPPAGHAGLPDFWVTPCPLSPRSKPPASSSTRRTAWK
jgi:elongation factor G